MPQLTYRTAGESHGPTIAALVEGMPAGLPVSPDYINSELTRRQGGYGRGDRMNIESDAVRILSGLIDGLTIASPILMLIDNADATLAEKPPVLCPRPGHADLAGIIKYGFAQARPVLERASARETAARVAAGALATILLHDLDIQVFSHVLSVGEVTTSAHLPPIAEAEQIRADSPFYCLDLDASGPLKAAVDAAREAGDTLGGVFEVIVHGVPIGLGSYVSADTRLDARIAAALMSIPAIKGVEIGLGFAAASRPGSAMHDPILPGAHGISSVSRPTNNAGGLEGGVTNGQDIVVRAAMKPISTLTQPLPSIDVTTGAEALASTERSDICAVPAASVVGQAAVAFEVARAILERSPSDSMAALRTFHRSSESE